MCVCVCVCVVYARVFGNTYLTCSIRSPFSDQFLCVDALNSLQSPSKGVGAVWLSAGLNAVGHL